MAKLLSFHEPRQMLPPHEKNSTDHRSFWPWRKFFAKEDKSEPIHDTPSDTPAAPTPRRSSKKVIPGLPRPGTFKRQQSELRDRLEPVKGSPHERRAFSVDPRRGESNRESPRTSVPAHPRVSAPSLLGTANNRHHDEQPKHVEETIAEVKVEDIAEPPPPTYDDVFDDDLEEELEKKWILNLSMHFKDRSNREKFFVTYAETPTHWRRVTISLDYRDAPRNSLEAELQHTQYQRDKSAKIYEAIRDSLPDIQFYDTVTNLKLATEHERLHVHVTEDVNEVIHFPSVSAIGHLDCPRFKEKDVVFDSHLSGFVYKVDVRGEVYIKKEIPGPDTVEEFLYEVNALHRLEGSKSVIKFGGVITDNEGRQLKGLLISYAEQGALVDVLYDGRGELSWRRRERWAKQIVQGLSEIHEAGYVQGDFTLSNIVIDEDDEAKIIDINRRGCPVGWEPPEIAALIASKQRISMYIGVKSDIFQLGMVLWAIATQQDEPEIQPKPLTLTSASGVPKYYRDLVDTCLSHDPRHRRNTSYLLDMFPCLEEIDHRDERQNGIATHYFDPAFAVEREDIDMYKASCTSEHTGVAISTGTHTYVNDPTDMSGEPYFFPTRGRSTTRSRHGTNDGNSPNTSPLSKGRPDEQLQTSQDAEPIVVDVSPERHYLEREAPTEADRLAEPDAYASPRRSFEAAERQTEVPEVSSAAAPALQEASDLVVPIKMEEVFDLPESCDTPSADSQQAVGQVTFVSDDKLNSLADEDGIDTVVKPESLSGEKLNLLDATQEPATIAPTMSIGDQDADHLQIANEKADYGSLQVESALNEQPDSPAMESQVVAEAELVTAPIMQPEHFVQEPSRESEITKLSISPESVPLPEQEYDELEYLLRDDAVNELVELGVPVSPAGIPLPEQEKDEIEVLLLDDITPGSNVPEAEPERTPTPLPSTIEVEAIHLDKDGSGIDTFGDLDDIPRQEVPAQDNSKDKPDKSTLESYLERPETPVPVITLSVTEADPQIVPATSDKTDPILFKPGDEDGARTPTSSRLYPLSDTGTERDLSSSTPFRNLSELAIYATDSERSREDDYVRVDFDEVDGKLTTGGRDFEKDLMGIGGHSTQEHLRYPQGMGLSSDDLTIEMRS